MNPSGLAEVLALISAVTFAGGDITGRFAVRHAPPFLGGLLGALIGLIVFGAIALAGFSPGDLNLKGVLWFLLAGAFHPGLGFVTLYMALERVGAARTSAIVGIAPLFGVLVAVLLLGERPGAVLLGGTVLIVLGVIFISLDEGAQGKGGVRRLAYPLLTAFLFGVVPVLRKAGLNHIPSPVLGMAVSSLGGLIVLVGCAGLFPPGARVRSHRLGLALYIVCGLIYALAVYLYFLALEKGSVSVVVPLLFTYPLFVLVIAAAVLRKLERITPRLLVGAVCTVAGAVVITRFG